MNRSGLTLVELVVALVVTGAALSAGYGAFSSIVDNRTRVAEASDEVSRTSAIRTAMISWLEGARVTVEQGGPQFRGLDGVYQHLDDDELWFLTTSDTPLGRGESIVRLYVDRDHDTPEEGLTAVIAEWRGVNSMRIMIDSTVQSLDVRYSSGLLGERQWLPSWISTTVLPKAVELTLRSATEASLPALLDLPILVPLRGGR